MDPINFTVDGVAYKHARMAGDVQMDVLALISPLIALGAADILPWLRLMRDQALTNGAGSLLDLNPEGALAHFGGFTRELARMPPEDRRFVMSTCLALVDKEISPNNWKAVWVPAAGRPADDALHYDLLLQLKIVGTVIQGTFSRFFLESL